MSGYCRGLNPDSLHFTKISNEKESTHIIQLSLETVRKKVLKMVGVEQNGML